LTWQTTTICKPTLPRRFVKVGGKFRNSQSDLLEKHRFNKKHDARIMIFTKCYISIDSVSIGLLFRKYDMVDIALWERIPHNEPRLKIQDECNRVKILKVFPQFLVIG
jgi:hypothetical protein